MSHTVHPYSHRLGIIRDWRSRWFGSGKKFRDNLKADTLIREFVTKKLTGMYVSSIEIERSQKVFRLIIKSSRPGLIIGRSGEGSEKLRNDVLMVLIWPELKNYVRAKYLCKHLEQILILLV
jgi:small subunit ribosomal protein S3